MSGMDDLLTWLRAHLDKDERVARMLLAESQQVRLTLEEPRNLGRYMPGWTLWPDVEQMAHDRLAEVEAKRRILDAHPFEHGIVGGVCGTCHGEGRIEVLWDGDNETTERVDTEMVWPCPTVRLLALSLAARTGYKEEWRP